MRISDLNILTDAQVGTLSDYGVNTDDDLWPPVGGDFPALTSTADLKEKDLETAVNDVFRPRLQVLRGWRPDITDDQLMLLFTARSVALQEGRLGSWPRRNWLMLVSLFLGLVLAVLVARALGLFQAIPAPLGLRDHVLVASRDLQTGTILGPSEVHSALLVSDTEFFTPADRLDGFRTAKPVGSQKPLRHSDVLRLQLVATRDLPAGALLPTDAISRTWSAFQPSALTQPGDAVGHRLKSGLRTGEIVLSQMVDSVPTWISGAELLITSSGSTFQLLSEDDLVLTESTTVPPDPPRFITRSDLTGHQIVSMTITSTNSALKVNQPVPVTLIFRPRDTGEKAPAPLMVQDAILLSASAPTSPTHSVLLAIKPEDLARAMPLISTADLLVLQPMP